LQELLAPRKVLFYGSRWNLIGRKADLAEDIATVARIGVEHLLDSVDFTEASVAQRMCWASERTISRLEDMAYCLLEFFDVNMPLLYDDRRKAFMRLQLEIIKHNDDESIFAWRSRDIYWRGLLAPWPDAFENSQSVVLTSKLPGNRLP
jgi:hypothetical protein